MPLLSGTQRNRGRPRPSSPSQRQQNRRAAELPEYEPPSFPLRKAFHRELAGLSNDADTRKYEEQLKQSIKLLTDNVRDINDRYVRREEELANLKRKRQGQGENEGEDGDARKRQQAEEEAVLRLRETVPALTTECDSAVRHIIDLRVELEDGRKAIQDTVRKAEAEGTNAAERDGGEEEDDDGDYVMRKPGGFRGPLQIWKDEQEKAAADYATRSLEQRYAVDNDYIGFKRLWWDAAHGVDGKPLPDASRWFSRNNGEDEEDEEDEDLVIAKEHIDILCPLSMVVMDKPYTSNICKHTFNKPAIMQFLRAQPGKRAKCPQTGCGKESSIKDFYDDQVMLRKIKRAQAEKERQGVDGDDDDDDDDTRVDVDEDGDESMVQPSSVKAERARDRGNQLLADLGLDPGEDGV